MESRGDGRIFLGSLTSVGDGMKAKIFIAERGIGVWSGRCPWGPSFCGFEKRCAAPGSSSGSGFAYFLEKQVFSITRKKTGVFLLKKKKTPKQRG